MKQINKSQDMKNNLYKYLIDHKKNDPDKISIISENNEITYRKLLKLIDLLEIYLVNNLNIKENDRIAILSTNRIEYIILLYASAKIGSSLVPINWRLTDYEIENILNEVKPKVLFSEKEFIKENHNILKITKLNVVDINFNNSFYSKIKNKNINNNSIKKIKNNINKTILIIYTSGTTGKPKGAMLTQKALFYNNLNSIHMHQFNKKDIILTVIPLFHVGGLNIQTIPALHIGATVILLKKFDIIQTIKFIKRYRPTYTVFVPSILKEIVKLNNWKSKLNSLKAITTGSTIVSPELIETYEKKSIKIIQVYGSTETCPIAICQNINDERKPYGNIGKPALKTKIKLFSNNNSKYGEIGVKGLNLFSGYWNNKKNSKEYLNNGWFMTGDIAEKNKDNKYFILGRNKDLIISGGENIYPAEVERIINQVKNIEESAVIGIPDDKWEEVPIAFIKIKNKSYSSNEVFQTMKTKLARYKIPKKIITIDEVPKNALGKIDYKILKEYYKNLDL